MHPDTQAAIFAALRLSGRCRGQVPCRKNIADSAAAPQQPRKHIDQQLTTIRADWKSSGIAWPQEKSNKFKGVSSFHRGHSKVDFSSTESPYPTLPHGVVPSEETTPHAHRLRHNDPLCRPRFADSRSNPAPTRRECLIVAPSHALKFIQRFPQDRSSCASINPAEDAAIRIDNFSIGRIAFDDVGRARATIRPCRASIPPYGRLPAQQSRRPPAAVSDGGGRVRRCKTASVSLQIWFSTI